MNKKFFQFLLALPLVLFCACGSDDDEISDTPPKQAVVINADGTASNGSVFTSIDQSNFYLDYVRYTIKDGALFVTGYNKDYFMPDVKIVPTVVYKGTTLSVRKIEDEAFRDCYQMTSVSIPNTVQIIGSMAFYGCTGLTSITIPSSVTSIKTQAFSGCDNIETLECHRNTVVGHFRGHKNLKKIILGEGVETISDEAFFGCSALSSLTIGNTVTTIGDFAFSHCTSLTSLYIPSSVTSIGLSAFQFCDSLKSIQVSNDNPVFDSRNDCNAIIRKADNNLFIGCKNTIIPDNVESIGIYAFYGCHGLTSISIPSGVTHIYGYSFHGCNNLNTVYCYAPVPPTLEQYAFYEPQYSMTLYVPASSLDSYKKAENWKLFKDILPIK